MYHDRFQCDPTFQYYIYLAPYSKEDPESCILALSGLGIMETKWMYDKIHRSLTSGEQLPFDIAAVAVED